MKVQAAVARSHGSTLRVESLELTEPGDDEVLVRIVACGVSQADIDAIDGRLSVPLPFVPGTEGSGIVERVGSSVSALAPGDTIILGFDFCGTCLSCLAGRPRTCRAFAARNLAGRRPESLIPFTDGTHAVHGHFFGQSAFATHAVCSAARATKLAKGSPLEVLAFLGGDVLLGAGIVLQEVREGDSVVIVGAGAVGLAATMISKARGAKTIVVMEADERRRMLASELGADAAVHPDKNLADLVRSLDADGAKLAVETTGTPHARRGCMESAAKGATCAFLAAPRGEDFGIVEGAEGAPRIVFLEDHLAPALLIPKLAALYARGDLPLEQLVDFYPFERVNDALDALRGGAVAKPVLRFSIGNFGDLDRARTEGARNDVPDKAPSREDAPAVGRSELVKS